MRLLTVFLIHSITVGVAVAQETPGPQAGPEKPTAATLQPLTINMDKAVSEVVARMLAIPRFEEHIEVRDQYQEALEAHLRAADLVCGATASGPPPQDEMNRFRGAQIPPHADLLAAGRLIAKKVKGLFSKGGKKPRFFLYAVRRKDEPTRAVYVVRDGPISEAMRASIPGTAWELVDRFAERDKAAEALTRLQRGVAFDSSKRDDAPRTLWAATGCSR
jgi:hypothetical protein